MKGKIFLGMLTSAVLCTSAYSAENSSVGVVNFATCVSDSKIGKQEQDSFEMLKKQMTAQIEDTEKQLNDLSAKFNDPDYLDGLSPEAEEDLKNQFRTLNEKMSQYQNQYYQVMNQANMRIIQTLSTAINAASAKVAKDKKLSMILNKDACFYYVDALDMTKPVIVEMDKGFSADQKQTAPATTSKEQKAKE